MQTTTLQHETRTAKVIELVSGSTKSFEDAVQHALDDAHASTRGITGCDVMGFNVKCDDDGRIAEYRATVRIAFGVERD